MKYGLMNIPLLQQLFTDKNIRIIPRNVDKNWMYEKIISISVSAFNPFHRSIYIAKHSAVYDWIKAGKKNDRKFNESDFLVKEALFLAHDYLHAWSCLLIQNLLPKIKYGYGEINEKNFEVFVFCHLLTEAVATVGLDYWYLSTIDLNKMTGLGTEMDILTVSYHEKNLEEFRQFNPQLNVQSKNFYEKIATFYCTGEFGGFDVQDMKNSPILKLWLNHELTYGASQRRYTREWFSYLSNDKVKVPKDQLDKPIKINKPWQKKIIKTIAGLLWNKVKHGIDVQLKTPSKKRWSRNRRLVRDFRFTNINAIKKSDLEKIMKDGINSVEFDYFFAQYVSAYDFSKIPEEEFKILSYIKEKRDTKSLLYFFEKNKISKIKTKQSSEPIDLFFLN